MKLIKKNLIIIKILSIIKFDYFFDIIKNLFIPLKNVFNYFYQNNHFIKEKYLR